MIVSELRRMACLGASRSAFHRMTAHLVTDPLMMAIWRRGKPDALLHHYDQGSQYASEKFQRLMAGNGVNCSMSRSGVAEPTRTSGPLVQRAVAVRTGHLQAAGETGRATQTRKQRPSSTRLISCSASPTEPRTTLCR